MGYFITGNSVQEQTQDKHHWKLIQNQLYMDDDGQLYFSPRRLWTDGYTVPLALLPLTGDRHNIDVRPAVEHDMGCRYHEVIRVKLSITQLKMKGYLQLVDGVTVCNDIPVEYLQVDKISKRDINDLLYRMMLSCGISKVRSIIYRFAVIFNINWYLKTGKKSITEYDLYNEDLGLVNGV